MSTKNATPETKVAKTQRAVVKKNEEDTDPFKDLINKLSEMEKLKGYYTKLKIKKDTLETALAKMKALDKKGSDHFEQNEVGEFPFHIILRGDNEYNRIDDIFKISKQRTVIAFTEHLLNEIRQLLEVFEADLLEYSKTINP